MNQAIVHTKVINECGVLPSPVGITAAAGHSLVGTLGLPDATRTIFQASAFLEGTLSIRLTVIPIFLYGS